ncbi:MAG: hypothetical protein SGI92_08085 [Bryobacteraceae bacterium]|nr:hypothetical protein [Bryobacteraceae bacterium]
MQFDVAFRAISTEIGSWGEYRRATETTRRGNGLHKTGKAGAVGVLESSGALWAAWLLGTTAIVTALAAAVTVEILITVLPVLTILIHSYSK